MKIVTLLWKNLKRIKPIALLLIIGLSLAACQNEAGAPADYPNGRLLVDTDWLADRLDDSSVRIIDMREPDAFAREHIPGAVNIPIEAVTATVNDIPLEFERTKVQAALTEAGLIPSMTAVIYDDLGMMSAARLFWTLEYVGHQDVRLLHGGWNAWVAAGGETTAEPLAVESTTYTGVSDPDKLATAAEVLASLDDPDVAIVDARSPQEYTGQIKLADRGGHIPGAVNLVWLETLTGGDVVPTTQENWQAELQDEDVERFKPAAEIRTMLEERDITPDKEVITYCQTLWRAAHTYFLLRLMGFDMVRGYDGSWAEWGNRSDLPVVTGPEPGSPPEATSWLQTGPVSGARLPK